MVDVSNRTLAFLLVATIVVSLGGTLLNLNKIGGGAMSVTGAATTGNVSLSIEADTTYNVTNTDIDFGQGSISGAQTYAILDSDYSPSVNWNASDINSFITLQNDGNVNINVTFTSNANATGFLGGTSPEFNYTVWDDEDNSCKLGLQTGLNSVVNESGSASTMNVCESLDFGAPPDFNDTVNISIRLYVPIDANQTVTLTTFTFDASQALH